MPPGHLTTIPQKGDLVINPNTSRPIRVGGTVWKKLVREGIFEGIYNDTKELGELPENEDEIQQEINEIQQTLPIGRQAVRGRGQYRGKIVSRSKPLNPDEVSRYTAKVASKTVKENINELVGSDDLEAELEQMIINEIAAKKVIPKKLPSTKPVAIPKRANPKEQYRLRKQQTTTEEETSDTIDEEIEYDE